MATGIQVTRFGFRAYIRVDGQLYSKRFDPTATIKQMEDWRAATRTDVRRESMKDREDEPDPSSFAADVTRYLATVATMPTYRERARHMALWRDRFGDRARHAITSAEVKAVLDDWRKRGHQGKPLSASACNHRRSALMHFYTVLDGKSGRNPARDVEKYTEPEPEPRGYPYPIIEGILDLMPPSKSRARLKVIAWTGLSPASVARIKPEDVDIRGRVFFRRRREKGQGTRGRSVPLLPQAAAAFRELAKLDAFGDFDHRFLGRVWVTAVHAFIAEKRKTSRRFTLPIYTVKDLRHSFGTYAYQVTGDLRTVGELMDHSTLDLTKRYTLKAVDQRLTDAVTAMQRSLMGRKVATRVATKRKTQ